MKLSKLIKKSRELASPYCITNGDGFRLKDIDPDDTGGLKSEDKPRAKEAWASAWKPSPLCRTCSMPRIAGPCCSFFRRWTRRERTEPSNM